MTSVAGKASEGLLGSLEAVRSRADELWMSGRRREATEVLRARASRPDGGRLWWPLYFKYQALGLYEAASVALRNAADLDPGNLEALEMLIEDVAVRGPEALREVALDRLPAALAGKTQKHFRALFFVLPDRHGAAIAALRDSDDPLVRRIVGLFETDQDPDDVVDPLAAGTLAMCTDRHEAARLALQRLPDEQIPIDGIRITTRRLLRTNANEQAREYLKILSRLRPHDAWVADKLVTTSVEVWPEERLTREGFPLSAKKSQPQYEPRPRTALYVLHNSLPFHSVGYSTRSHGLLRAIRDHGWDVQGVTRLGYPFDMPKLRDLSGISSRDVIDGIPYRRLTTAPPPASKRPLQFYVHRYAQALSRLAREERPSLIHAASNHWNGLAAVQAANELGLPSIYEVRGLWEVTRASKEPDWAHSDMYQYMARMETEAARHATHVFAITQALKDELISRGVEGSKISLVPNGVNAERFSPKPRNQALAERVGVVGKPVIGYIGTVLDYEGLGLLIDAAGLLASEGRDFVVLIVGDGADLLGLQSVVHDRRLDDYVRFTGRVPHDEVEEYYSLIDIAPFPRLPLPVCEMVSPLKPFEAMAMAKTVVASDVAALAEIVAHEATGLLHRKGDAADLKAQLARLLDDTGLRGRLAQAGRDWVLSERQWSVLGGRVTNIYDELSVRVASETSQA